MTMVSFNGTKCLLATLLLSISSRPVYTQAESTSQPEVTITQGNLRGKILTTHNGRNISAFLGIPYAQPPTGSLRFADPVAADGWNGTRNAIVDPSMCPQVLAGIKLGQEDCLYLNVYTPKLFENTSSTVLPVMVFIYGGSYLSGSSQTYGPVYIADKDVILVTLNYRLGPMGFLSTGDEVASGNWGLKDQVLALKWVRNNIGNFGGDPDHVTIFGESAGAASVHLLTLSNSTTGLFHKFITQSGSALSPWAYIPRAAYADRAFELGGYVGCSNATTESLVNCLRETNISDILGVYSKFYTWRSQPSVVWAATDEPDVEGAFLTDSPTNLINAGKIRDIPWMTGSNRDEGLFITTELYENETLLNDFVENVDSVLPVLLSLTYQEDSGAAWVKSIKSFYFNDDFSTNKTEILDNLTRLISDARYIYPNYAALQQQLNLAGNPQYLYTFNYLGSLSFTFFYGGSTVEYGVAHGDDLIYLFPLESTFQIFNKTMSSADLEMVETMVELWTSFAINGTPAISGVDGTTTWTQYSTDDNYLQIGDGSELETEVKSGFLKERMQFWANLNANSSAVAN
ncbi:venom carboxylesterase-6-like [Neodiprion virginianus]|uniref:venom carboxylesterase-6-like n=1 Tax=Neodiprion virginianus TaxID=2961670 RepID=UPI001EE6F72C|nr:venom carboxylesterase-6-like [Neodiprion virginianus]